MKEQLKSLKGRRRWFLGSLGAVAAGAAVVSSAGNAQSSTPAKAFTPARSAEDDWMDQIPGVHRAFLDSSSSTGGITALNYAHNILFTNVEDYGGQESDYAMIVCFRHQSTPLGYNEAMWAKYGEQLSGFMAFKDPRTDEVFKVNPMDIPNRSDFASRGHTLTEMASRGVRYAVCNRATHSISSFLARATNGNADEIYTELAANLIPYARMVPAGVMAATRAQERGYSLLAAG